MYGDSFQATVQAIKVKAKEDDGRMFRICTLTLETEFDDMIAAGLGGDAKGAQEALFSGGLTKAEIPIGLVEAKLSLFAGSDRLTIKEARGIKAAGTVAKGAGENPRLKLDFAFAYSDDVWAYLGRNSAALVTARVVKLQASLPLNSQQTV